MASFAVRSCLDVVFWFNDQALNDQEYLQPHKLHRLLFLAQAYYAVANRGRKLIPATFVVDSTGPIEPTVYQTFAFGNPYMIEPGPISETVEHFLSSIWRRFGQYSADGLSKKLATHQPVAEAMEKGIGEEITLDSMIKFYGVELAAQAARKGQQPVAPTVGQVVRPRIMRDQSGKAVAVTAWVPGQKKTS